MKKYLLALVLTFISIHTFAQSDWGLKALERAKNGDVEAMGKVATGYSIGGGGLQENAAECYRWALKGAMQDNAVCAYYLGQCYAFGLGVEKNSDAAIKWLKKADELGDINASNMLGMTYESISKTDATYWHKRHADLYYVENKEIPSHSIDHLKALGVDYDPTTNHGKATRYAKNKTIKFKNGLTDITGEFFSSGDRVLDVRTQQVFSKTENFERGSLKIKIVGNKVYSIKNGKETFLWSVENEYVLFDLKDWFSEAVSPNIVGYRNFNKDDEHVGFVRVVRETDNSVNIYQCQLFDNGECCFSASFTLY